MIGEYNFFVIRISLMIMYNLVAYHIYPI